MQKPILRAAALGLAAVLCLTSGAGVRAEKFEDAFRLNGATEQDGTPVDEASEEVDENIPVKDASAQEENQEEKPDASGEDTDTPGEDEQAPEEGAPAAEYDLEADREVERIAGQIVDLQTEIDGLDEELVGTLTDIEELESRISENEKKIKDAKDDLKAAEDAKARQHEDMKERVKYMYENGDEDLVSLMASSGDFGEFVSKMDYADSVHEYDRNMLSSYQSTVEGIEHLKTELANDQAELESDKSCLVARKMTLDTMLEEKHVEMEGYNQQLQVAKERARVASNLRLEAQRRANAAAAAAYAREQASEIAQASGSTYEDDDYVTAKAAKASGKGTAVARFASKFVGYPYVWGGNSLTHGCDCSGFVVQVYKHFGVDLSATRTSGELRGVGRAVSLKNIQPGDIVCYEGHVAIYYGNGLICEAQCTNAGITMDRPVTCKSIITIRRIF